MASALTGATAMLAGVGLDEGATNPYHRMARDDAVSVLNQFAQTYRRLAEDDPATHEPGLAATLKILYEALWLLGRPEDSLAAGREAVELRRRLHATPR